MLNCSDGRVNRSSHNVAEAAIVIPRIMMVAITGATARRARNPRYGTRRNFTRVEVSDGVYMHGVNPSAVGERGGPGRTRNGPIGRTPTGRGDPHGKPDSESTRT